MKIVIDAQSILGKRAGIGEYVYEVLKRLPIHFIGDTIKLCLFSFLKNQTPPSELITENVTLNLHSLFPRRALEGSLKLGISLPFPWFSGQGDVFLFPNFIAYPTGKKPTILIIYDLSYLRYPSHAEGKNQEFLTKFVPVSIKRATSVITISSFSRNEIIDAYGFSEDRIHIAYPGVDTSLFHPIKDNLMSRQTLVTLGIPTDYILFIGTLEPRKGIEPLLHAYESWDDKNKPPLVLIGKRGWGHLPNLERAQHGDIDGVICPGYVDRDMIPILLSHALLFVYPSMYEGFGMPVLEAMACGTPVVCGNCPSFREIGNDSLTYCDVTTPESIREAIYRTLTSPPSAKALDIGVKRASMFTWDVTAAEVASVIKSTLTP